MSFIADKVVSEGFTFDDVLITPYYSDNLIYKPELSSRNSRKINMNTTIC